MKNKNKDLIVDEAELFKALKERFHNPLNVSGGRKICRGYLSKRRLVSRTGGNNRSILESEKLRGAKLGLYLCRAS